MKVSVNRAISTQGIQFRTLADPGPKENTAHTAYRVRPSPRQMIGLDYPAVDKRIYCPHNPTTITATDIHRPGSPDTTQHTFRGASMAELFSDEWMKNYMTAWNSEPELSDALAKIAFNSTIAYGIDGEPSPRGVLVVENGKAVSAGAYDNEALDWDLRARPENWEKWMKKGIGMMALGVAYTSRKLKFEQGDYMGMIKDLRMAGPFIKSFTVMGRV